MSQKALCSEGSTSFADSAARNLSGDGLIEDGAACAEDAADRAAAPAAPAAPVAPVASVASVATGTASAPGPAPGIAIRPALERLQLSQRLMLNGVLWTAGNSLTTGSFLNYFAQDVGLRGWTMSLLLVTPEIMGTVALGVGQLLAFLPHRKRLWVGSTLLARGCWLLIPLAALDPVHAGSAAGQAWLLGCVALGAMLQGISYVLYQTWLSSLIPAHEWSSYFARRNAASLASLLIVPLAVAAWKEFGLKDLPADRVLLGYVIAFVAGNALQLLSLWPLLKLPDAPLVTPARARSSAGGDAVARLPEQEPDTAHHWDAARRRRNVNWILAHSWFLGLSAGLTQAAFYEYQRYVLGLSLWTYLALQDVMFLGQLIWSLSLRQVTTPLGYRNAMVVGGLVMSTSLVFWCLATPEHWWWLTGAFVAWSGFAALNLAGPNLLLSQSETSRRDLDYARYRQVAGLLAGLSGFAGGAVMTWMTPLANPGEPRPIPYATILALFVISGIGRCAASLLLLGVRVSRSPTSEAG